MIFNKHFELEGAHAFLSASKYHWINYDEEKLDYTFATWQAARRGTELHAFAHEAIRLGERLPRSRRTLNMYVNDAIGFRMTTEQTLFYSSNCFGTADAISYARKLLRVHDLKSGVTPASMNQPRIYAALFCLEYGFKPASMDMELRIYQNDEVQVENPDPDVITHIMDKIITFDKRIERLKLEG